MSQTLLSCIDCLIDTVLHTPAELISALLAMGTDVNGCLIGTNSRLTNFKMLVPETVCRRVRLLQARLCRSILVHVRDLQFACLMQAPFHGETDLVVRALVSAGADVNLQRNDGFSPQRS